MNWMTASSFKEKKKARGRKVLIGWVSVLKEEGGGREGLLGDHLACSADTQRAARRKVYRTVSAERQGLKDV